MPTMFTLLYPLPSLPPLKVSLPLQDLLYGPVLYFFIPKAVLNGLSI
jgi:hypothetical protein